jgi:lipoate-protein ligase A
VRLVDLTLGSVHDDLALDERLFRALDRDGDPAFETLRFWERPSPAVVLGRGGRLADDVDVGACAAGGVPVCRRASGGGTVVVGPGCLCFSLVLAYERRPRLRAVPESHRLIGESLVAALAVPGLALRGESDLALGERKVSGSAQLRGRHGLLHQGTLLHRFELALLPRFLFEPRRRPSYRGPRPHLDFVANLPLRADLLKTRLAAAWHVSAS